MAVRRHGYLRLFLLFLSLFSCSRSTRYSSGASARLWTIGGRHASRVAPRRVKNGNRDVRKHRDVHYLQCEEKFLSRYTGLVTQVHRDFRSSDVIRAERSGRHLEIQVDHE